MNPFKPKTDLQPSLNPNAPEGFDPTGRGKSRQHTPGSCSPRCSLRGLEAYAVDPPPPAVPAAAPAKASLAKIQFATPIYDFGKVTAGEPVNHTYIFTNIGTETLQIASVTPSCGCTTAGEWTHSVEPGKTGTIPVRFNSPNFGGPVAKTVTVRCNDAGQETVVLQIKGTVWQPIDVKPAYAILSPTTESPSATTTVRITNNLEQAITLSPPESNNKAFEAELKTIQPGRVFEVTVKTVPPLAAGNVSAIISLKTSATNMAAVSITAFANVQPVVTVQPLSINLPSAPMAQSRPTVVTIRSTSTNALVLSEPSINAKGVEVQLKEVEAGRHFTATLSFPAGFEIAAGEKIELSLKSNHPQFAAIKVPILQAPRPAPLATPLQSQVISPPSPPTAQKQ